MDIRLIKFILLANYISKHLNTRPKYNLDFVQCSSGLILRFIMKGYHL